MLLIVALNLFLPTFMLSLVLSAPVFMIARKRKVNGWLWTALTLIPLFGWIVAIGFFAATALSILDRVGRLETDRSFS